MQFVREKLAGSLGNNVEALIARRLGEEYRPVIIGGRQELLQVLQPDSVVAGVGGEIFVSPSGSLLFYRIGQGKEGIVAGGAWEDGLGGADWNYFRSCLAEVVGNKSWMSLPIVSERFRLLTEEAEPLQVGTWERNASAVLQRLELRRLLRVVAAAPSIPLQTAAQGRSLNEVGQDVQEMDSLGILSRDFEVFCRETQQKVSRVSSLAALDDAAGRGFRCFHCGRPISEEQIVQALTVTSDGERLAKPNMWLAYMVGAALADLGVAADRIVYRHERDYKTVEVFADINGSLFMFAICEDGVPADAAFRFVTRTRFFRPDFGFMVSPVPVCQEAKRVLAGSTPELCSAESMVDLSDKVKLAISKVTSRVLDELLGSFSELTVLELDTLVGKYFITDEQIGDLSEPKHSAQAEAPAGEAGEVGAAQEAIQSQGPEELPAEGEGQGVDGGVEQSQDAEMRVLEQQVQKILNVLPDVYASDDTAALGDLVQGVSDIPGSSAMIASSDGLPFLGSLETYEDADSAAALQLDLVVGVDGCLSGVDMGKLSGIVLNTSSGTLSVYPSVDGLALLIHRAVGAEASSLSSSGERRSVRSAEREAYLQKALKQMSRLPGVSGSLVMRRGGGLIQSACSGISTEQVASLLSVVPELVTTSIEPFVADLGIEKWNAVMLHTSKYWYSIIGLEQKAFLVNVLDRDSAPAVWREGIVAQAEAVLAALG